ncbi:unnamed protein product [Lampetra planeri]
MSQLNGKEGIEVKCDEQITHNCSNKPTNCPGCARRPCTPEVLGSAPRSYSGTDVEQCVTFLQQQQDGGPGPRGRARQRSCGGGGGGGVDGSVKSSALRARGPLCTAAR